MSNVTKVIILLIAIIIIAKTPLGNRIPVLNASSNAKAVLQQEFDNIDPCPGSEIVDSSSESRFIDANVQYKYTTSRNWTQVCNHYSDEASENGWEQDGNESTRKMGKSGEIITFHKGNYYLVIETDNIQKTSFYTVMLRWQVYPNFSKKT